MRPRRLPSRDLVRTALGSPSLLGLGQVFAAAAALASAPIVARAIGPEGRGETASALAAMYFFPILLGLGVPMEVRRRVALGSGSSVVTATSRFATALTVVSVPLAIGFVQLVLPDADPGLRAVTAIGIMLLPFQVRAHCDLGILIVCRSFGSVFAMVVLPGIVALLTITAAYLFATVSASLVVGSWAVGNLAAFLVGVFGVRRALAPSLMREGSLVRGGMRFAGSAAAEAAANRFDQILAVPVMGAVQAGYYSVAVTLGVLPLIVAHTLSAATFQAHATSHGDDIREMRRRSLRLALLGCGGVSLVIGLLAPVAVPVIFGESFRSAVAPALLGLAAGWIGSLAFVASMGLAAEGRGKVLTAIQCAGLVIGLTLLVLLAPSMGAVGAAAASLLAGSVVLAAIMRASGLGLGDLRPRAGDIRQMLGLFMRGGRR